MKGSHFHVSVRDLEKACHWLTKTWNIHSSYRNERMAVFPCGAFSLIVDLSENDTEATIAFESQNCEGEFREVVSRGAIPLEPPTQQPWGVTVAYIQGPGRLTFEIEELLDVDS